MKRGCIPPALHLHACCYVVFLLALLSTFSTYDGKSQQQEYDTVLFVGHTPLGYLASMNITSFTFHQAAHDLQDVDIFFVPHAADVAITPRVRFAKRSSCGALDIRDMLRQVPCSSNDFIWYKHHQLALHLLAPRYAAAFFLVKQRKKSHLPIIVSEYCSSANCTIVSLLAPCVLVTSIPPFTSSSDSWLRYIVHNTNEASLPIVDASSDEFSIANIDDPGCHEVYSNHENEKLYLGFAAASRYHLDETNQLIDRKILRWKYLPTVSSERTLKRGITAVIQARIDRLSTLQVLLNRWSGPVALALFQVTGTEGSYMQNIKAVEMLQLHFNLRYTVMTSQPQYYHVNLLRNAALSLVATEFFLFLDGDYVPSVGLHAHLMAIYDSLLQNTHTCTVVPVFFESQKRSARPIPRDMNEVKAMLISGAINIPSEGLRPYQDVVNYSRWLNARSWYRIQYRLNFEPFCVVFTRNSPWFDSRFRSGFGKEQYALHLHRLGFNFNVISLHFLIRVHHFEPAWMRGEKDVSFYTTGEQAALVQSYIRYG